MTDTAPEVAAFVTAVAGLAERHGRAATLAGAARSLARAAEVVLDESSLRLFTELGMRGRPAKIPVVGRPPDGAEPDLLGRCFETLLAEGDRVAGAHHTPLPVARRVVARASEPMEPPPLTICDPAVGGGVFLLAAAEHLHGRGLSRAGAVDRLWGFDVDPLAVAVTEASLALWAGARPAAPGERLRVGDFLERSIERLRPVGGWSMIVGNPPFQSQLVARTARDRERASTLERRFGAAAAGYVDTAGLFVLAGVEHLAPGGTLALILPASVLAAVGARLVREAVESRATMRSLWVPDRRLFAAAVDVVVPVLQAGRSSGSIDIVGGGPGRGEAAMTVADAGAAWSTLLADAEGVPRVDLPDGPGTIGAAAFVTAGFRQHFYGLADAVEERPDGTGRPLMTVGLVDPLTDRWGDRPTRLAGVRYEAPIVCPERLADAEVARWVAARHRPKILVATQTRAVEAVVDAVGATVPSTPLISVEPHDEADLWLLAAVLCAPPVTAWLHRSGAGAGLSRGRIRPTAGRMREVPVPSDRDGWARAAALARRASADPDADRRRSRLVELGAVMTAAYGADPAVTAWWEPLLPPP